MCAQNCDLISSQNAVSPALTEQSFCASLSKLSKAKQVKKVEGVHTGKDQISFREKLKAI